MKCENNPTRLCFSHSSYSDTCEDYIDLYEKGEEIMFSITLGENDYYGCYEEEIPLAKLEKKIAEAKEYFKRKRA